MYSITRDANGRALIPSTYYRELPPGVDPGRFSLYRSFVFYRHLIWESRQAGYAPPWAPPAKTILNNRKFTNVFRVLDPGSQYVVKMLQEPGLEPEDALARAILYRFTNRPETWDHLKNVLGRWPLASDMNGSLVRALHDTPGGQIFSGAYIIMPTPGKEGDKVAGAVGLTRRLTLRGGPERVVEQVVGAPTPAAAYEALRGHYGMGDFMSMQVLTDWGYYWPEYDENIFVVAGPGSKRGVAELYTERSMGYGRGRGRKTVEIWAPEDIIRWVRDDWALDVTCPVVPLPGGGERVPSLMDIQNTFCEFSKYMRYVQRGAHGEAAYRPAHPGAQPIPVLPHHWTATS